jgi:cytochrome P450
VWSTSGSRQLILPFNRRSPFYIVLRLYPSVPINSRTALKTTTLPVGGGKDGRSPILVRKGEAVGYCVYSMHRRCDLYGQDADVFRPERWEDDPVKGPNLKNIGWAYVPFNAGPRVCLGRTFSLLFIDKFPCFP